MSATQIRRLIPRASQVLLVFGVASAQADPGVAAQEQQAPLVIVNVNVVPMDRERVLGGHTVVIRDGRIAAVAPSGSVTVPPGANVIDGTGRYLIPGLVDMHIHAVGGAGERGDGAWQQMTLLVVNGVTTARSLAGASTTALAVRQSINDGRMAGPRLYLAGPSLNQNSVKTAEDAGAEVRKQVDAGFDFIKTHGVTSEVYDAMAQAATDAGIRLVGHVTPQYGLERAFAARQQIEHLDGYLAATVPAGSAVTVPPGQLYYGDELGHMDERAMRGLAERTAALGIWNSPTLAIFETIARPLRIDEYLAWPEMRYVPPGAKAAWGGQVGHATATAGSAEARERFVELRRAMTRALRDAGAGILAGSDSPQLFMAPGFALHRELAALQRAGLTPYEALAAATVNPARYMGADFGEVAVGKVADLVLLERNPLDDVVNASSIQGLVLRGRWLSAAELLDMRESVAQFNAGN